MHPAANKADAMLRVNLVVNPTGRAQGHRALMRDRVPLITTLPPLNREPHVPLS